MVMSGFKSSVRQGFNYNVANKFWFVNARILQTILAFDNLQYKFDPFFFNHLFPHPRPVVFYLREFYEFIYDCIFEKRKFLGLSPGSNFYYIGVGLFLRLLWFLGSGHRFLPVSSSLPVSERFGFYDLKWTPLFFLYTSFTFLYYYVKFRIRFFAWEALLPWYPYSINPKSFFAYLAASKFWFSNQNYFLASTSSLFRGPISEFEAICNFEAYLFSFYDRKFGRLKLFFLFFILVGFLVSVFVHVFRSLAFYVFFGLSYIYYILPRFAAWPILLASAFARQFTWHFLTWPELHVYYRKYKILRYHVEIPRISLGKLFKKYIGKYIGKYIERYSWKFYVAFRYIGVFDSIWNLGNLYYAYISCSFVDGRRLALSRDLSNAFFLSLKTYARFHTNIYNYEFFEVPAKDFIDSHLPAKLIADLGLDSISGDFVAIGTGIPCGNKTSFPRLRQAYPFAVFTYVRHTLDLHMFLVVQPVLLQIGFVRNIAKIDRKALNSRHVEIFREYFVKTKHLFIDIGSKTAEKKDSFVLDHAINFSPASRFEVFFLRAAYQDMRRKLKYSKFVGEYSSQSKYYANTLRYERFSSWKGFKVVYIIFELFVYRIKLQVYRFAFFCVFIQNLLPAVKKFVWFVRFVYEVCVGNTLFFVSKFCINILRQILTVITKLYGYLIGVVFFVLSPFLIINFSHVFKKLSDYRHFNFFFAYYIVLRNAYYSAKFEYFYSPNGTEQDSYDYYPDNFGDSEKVENDDLDILDDLDYDLDYEYNVDGRPSERSFAEETFSGSEAGFSVDTYISNGIFDDFDYEFEQGISSSLFFVWLTGDFEQFLNISAKTLDKSFEAQDNEYYEAFVVEDPGWVDQQFSRYFLIGVQPENRPAIAAWSISYKCHLDNWYKHKLQSGIFKIPDYLKGSGIGRTSFSLNSLTLNEFKELTYFVDSVLSKVSKRNNYDVSMHKWSQKYVKEVWSDFSYQIERNPRPIFAKLQKVSSFPSSFVRMQYPLFRNTNKFFKFLYGENYKRSNAYCRFTNFLKRRNYFLSYSYVVPAPVLDCCILYFNNFISKPDFLKQFSFTKISTEFELFALLTFFNRYTSKYDAAFNDKNFANADDLAQVKQVISYIKTVSFPSPNQEDRGSAIHRGFIAFYKQSDGIRKRRDLERISEFYAYRFDFIWNSFSSFLPFVRKRLQEDFNWITVPWKRVLKHPYFYAYKRWKDLGPTAHESTWEPLTPENPYESTDTASEYGDIYDSYYTNSESGGIHFAFFSPFLDYVRNALFDPIQINIVYPYQFNDMFFDFVDSIDEDISIDLYDEYFIHQDDPADFFDADDTPEVTGEGAWANFDPDNPLDPDFQDVDEWDHFGHSPEGIAKIDDDFLEHQDEDLEDVIKQAREWGADVYPYMADMRYYIEDNANEAEWEVDEFDGFSDLSIPLSRLFFGGLRVDKSSFPATDPRMFLGPFSGQEGGEDLSLDYSKNFKIAKMAADNTALAIVPDYPTNFGSRYSDYRGASSVLFAIFLPIFRFLLFASICVSGVLNYMVRLALYPFEAQDLRASSVIDKPEVVLHYLKWSSEYSSLYYSKKVRTKLLNWISDLENYSDKVVSEKVREDWKFTNYLQNTRMAKYAEKFSRFWYMQPFVTANFWKFSNTNFNYDVCIKEQHNKIFPRNFGLSRRDRSAFSAEDELAFVYYDFVYNFGLSVANEDSYVDYDAATLTTFSTDDDLQVLHNLYVSKMELALSAISDFFIICGDYSFYACHLFVKTRKAIYLYWVTYSERFWLKMFLRFGLKAQVFRFVFSFSLFTAISLYIFFILPRLLYYSIGHVSANALLLLNAYFSLAILVILAILFFNSVSHYFLSLSSADRFTYFVLSYFIHSMYVRRGYLRHPWNIISGTEDLSEFPVYGSYLDFTMKPMQSRNKSYLGPEPELGYSDTRVGLESGFYFYMGVELQGEKYRVAEMDEGFEEDFKPWFSPYTFSVLPFNFYDLVCYLRGETGILSYLPPDPQLDIGYRYLSGPYLYSMNREIVRDWHRYFHRPYHINFEGHGRNKDTMYLKLQLLQLQDRLYQVRDRRVRTLGKSPRLPHLSLLDPYGIVTASSLVTTDNVDWNIEPYDFRPTIFNYFSSNVRYNYNQNDVLKFNANSYIPRDRLYIVRSNDLDEHDFAKRGLRLWGRGPSRTNRARSLRYKVYGARQWYYLRNMLDFAYDTSIFKDPISFAIYDFWIKSSLKDLHFKHKYASYLRDYLLYVRPKRAYAFLDKYASLSDFKRHPLSEFDKRNISKFSQRRPWLHAYNSWIRAREVSDDMFDVICDMEDEDHPYPSPYGAWPVRTPSPVERLWYPERMKWPKWLGPTPDIIFQTELLSRREKAYNRELDHIRDLTAYKRYYTSLNFITDMQNSIYYQPTQLYTVYPSQKIFNRLKFESFRNPNLMKYILPNKDYVELVAGSISAMTNLHEVINSRRVKFPIFSHEPLQKKSARRFLPEYVYGSKRYRTSRFERLIDPQVFRHTDLFFGRTLSKLKHKRKRGEHLRLLNKLVAERKVNKGRRHVVDLPPQVATRTKLYYDYPMKQPIWYSDYHPEVRKYGKTFSYSNWRTKRGGWTFPKAQLLHNVPLAIKPPDIIAHFRKNLFHYNQLVNIFRQNRITILKDRKPYSLYYKPKYNKDSFYRGISRDRIRFYKRNIATDNLYDEFLDTEGAILEDFRLGYYRRWRISPKYIEEIKILHKKEKAALYAGKSAELAKQAREPGQKRKLEPKTAKYTDLHPQVDKRSKFYKSLPMEKRQQILGREALVRAREVRRSRAERRRLRLEEKRALKEMKRKKRLKKQ